MMSVSRRYLHTEHDPIGGVDQCKRALVALHQTTQ